MKLHGVALHRKLRVIEPGPRDAWLRREATNRYTMTFDFTLGEGGCLREMARRMAAAAGFPDPFLAGSYEEAD